MYSRIMETYLTVCVPELKVTVRQYGWSGETAPGFLARMTNDCLRFKPAVATTCYGMNDHGYRPYEPPIGQRYRDASAAIVRAFKQAGARVVQGSPGCVGIKVPWSTNQSEAMNLNLCELRNLGLDIAAQENVRFADVFWPMFTGGFVGQQRYGADFAIAGKDAVHPDWAGQLVMAYAFLKALGLDGDLGTFTVDLKAGKATASAGHEVRSFKDGELTILSSRYPFCAGGATNKDNSIRAGMTLVPFNRELNRLTLVVKDGAAQNYKVTWGANSGVYSAQQLAKGVNLAEDFVANPFSAAFAKVDAAVVAKQNYETRQIKMLFHGEEGRADMEATAALTEKVRSQLAAAIPAAIQPVTHTLKIEPE
jgi:lysophospholipase L1-like esterase